MLLLWVCLLGGAIPASAWKDIKIDLTNGNLLTSDEITNKTMVKFGVAIADDGTATRVDADDASAAIVLNGKFHSNEHGWGNFSATVAVDGPVKVSMGTCAWGGDVKITNASGTQVGTFNTNTGACYHSNKTANIASTIYKGDATTLTISGGSYTPYIAVEKVSDADLKTDYKVTFSLGSVTAEGFLPAEETVEEGSSLTIPTNHSLYIEGKTLTGWTDGTNTYKVGDDMTVTANTTLTPVFKDNTKTLADRTSSVTLLWDFQRKNGAPTMQYQNKTNIYVTQATIGGETIDVKMDVDTNNGGKLNNSNWNDWCQMNGGTKLTIPSCKDAVVSIESYSELGASGKTATTIDGSSDYTSSKAITYTVTSESETIDIVIGNDGTYYRTVQTVLPKKEVAGNETIFSFSLTAAEDVTLNNKEEADLSKYGTITGGTAKLYCGKDNQKLINKSGNIMIHGSGGHHFTITLSDNKTFEEGDIISVTTTNGKYAGEVTFTNANTSTNTLDKEGKYTVKAADAGKTEFYIYRGAKSTEAGVYDYWSAFSGITVTRPAKQEEVEPALTSLKIGEADILSSIEGTEYTYNVTSYDNLPQVSAEANENGIVETTQASADNGYKATVVLKNKTTEKTVKTYTITFNKVNIISGKQFTWSTGDGSSTALTGDADYKYIRTSEVNPSFAIKGKSNVYSDSRFKAGMGTGNTWALIVPKNAIVEKVEFTNCSENYYQNPNTDSNLTTTFNVASEGATVTTTDANGNVLQYLSKGQLITATLANHQAGTPITFYADGGQQLAFSGINIYYSITDNGSLKLVKQSVSDGATVERNGNIVLTFDNDVVLADGAKVKVNGSDVRTVANGTQLTAYYWNLAYDSENTVTLAANSVVDGFGNKYDKEISFKVNVGSKKAVEMKEYDYVVSNAEELDAAIAELATTNKSATAERKTVFLKNGNYTYGTLEGSYQYNVSLKIDNWNSIYNVSLIGESKDGVVISGTTNGITSSTLNLGDGTGNYLQDLTVRNNLEFRTNNYKAVNVAMLGGNKAILKNVALQASQDTYVTGKRTYLEDCDIYGTTDFICGGGDIFFERCNLILGNKSGNVIVAPSTDATKKWGYVLQNCTVKADEGATNVTDKSWHLGRPWQNEPRAYYLNTKMEVLCSDAGWTNMGNLTTHFYEYNSVNKNGEKIDLSTRKNSPSSLNSYTPILSDEEAKEFTAHNVLGGSDSWDAPAYTKQLAKAELKYANGKLTWNTVEDARCYAIFMNGEYVANTTSCEYATTINGTWTVRAANEMGGLGEESDAVNVMTQAKLSAGGMGTFCSGVSCKAPEELNVYTASVKDNVVTLNKVADGIIPAGEGVVLGGEANKTYEMTVCEANGTLDENQLKGTTERTLISNDYSFVLVYDKAEDASYFKNFQNGAYIPAGKAYLEIPAAMQGAKLKVVVNNGETNGINSVEADNMNSNGEYFTLSGQKTVKPQHGIYIHNGKKVIIK